MHAQREGDKHMLLLLTDRPTGCSPNAIVLQRAAVSTPLSMSMWLIPDNMDHVYIKVRLSLVLTQRGPDPHAGHVIVRTPARLAPVLQQRRFMLPATSGNMAKPVLVMSEPMFRDSTEQLRDGSLDCDQSYELALSSLRPWTRTTMTPLSRHVELFHTPSNDV
jgi:hypothetical protein